MKLLIVESPAKAKTIGKYLGEREYTVLSSYGHVRGIPTKKDAIQVYDKHMEIHYEVVPSAAQNIVKLAQASKKASAIYFATDPDREGEAISWHLLEVLKQNHAIYKNTELKRVVFHEITEKAIRAAIEQPRDINMDLVRAQQARQALDYIVGFTLSPILWRKLPGSKSAGRVQSVALRMICEREEEIESFKKQEYWKIYGTFCPEQNHKEDTTFNNSKNTIFRAELIAYKKRLEKFDITTEAQALNIIERLKQYDYCISKVTTKKTTHSPKPPFTTSTLLQEASYKLGYTAKKTAHIAQRLYEGVDIQGKPTALITYMRTDSVSVSQESAEAANMLIAELYGCEYAPTKIRGYKNKIKNAQEAHEAIRPVDVKVIPANIKHFVERDLYLLYDLIWRRFIASQMSNALLENTSIEIVDYKINEENGCNSLHDNTDGVIAGKTEALFKTTGSVVLFQGYRKVYDDVHNIVTNNTKGSKAHGCVDQNDEVNLAYSGEQTLPVLSTYQRVYASEIVHSCHSTKPPSRFNEASLVKKLEELGIGRPSTYPTIISILQNRKYVVLQNKQFVTESRGRLVNAFLCNFFSEYIQYEFTAHMEDMLDAISRGEKRYMEELMEFWGKFKLQAESVMALNTRDVLYAVEQSLLTYIYGPLTNDNHNITERMLCPECHIGTLALKNSRFSPFIGCNRYPECKFVKQFQGCCDDTNLTNVQSRCSENGQIEQETNVIAREWPKNLGVDISDGQDVILNKGPYGFYVMKKIINNSNTKAIRDVSDIAVPKQRTSKKNSVKIVGVPKNVDPQSVHLEYALKLLRLPKLLGVYPDDRGEIRVNIGRYGPYLQYKNQFIALKISNFIDITCDDAIKVIKEKITKTVQQKKR